MGPTTPLLQIVHALYPQSPGEIEQYAWEVARALGGWVLSLTPQSGPAPPAWEGLQVMTPAAGEGALSAWHRALDIAQPQAVFVQSLGAMSPSLLLDLRERSIPYAVFLHDFTPLCPTQRLWHRTEERCSGPGRTGFKCAWCVSGELRRIAELPLRMVVYRHRPQDWRTAMVRADALVASSRFARDFWIEQGAPPERIAVIAPRLGLEDQNPASASASPQRRLLFAGGPGHASGAELLGAALDQMQEPLQLDMLNVHDEAAQLRLRAGFAARHQLVFHPPVPPAAMPPLLSACGVVVVPSRWEQPFSRLAADAQAAGARVVATAIGGLAEQIIHGVNGFLAAPDDASALAEALLEAYANTQPAWAGERVPENAQAQGVASADALRTLFDLLARGATEPDPALALEHGAWLAQQAGRDRTSPLEAAQRLALALRHGEDSSPDFQTRAFTTTRRWRMEMNHAIAFFRGCGCRRIASVGPEPATPDTVDGFSIWGLDLVPAQELPEGLWFEGDSPNPDLLQRRFPQAKALVESLPEGLETVDWTDNLTEP